jgi:hypothetical protein
MWISDLFHQIEIRKSIIYYSYAVRFLFRVPTVLLRGSSTLYTIKIQSILKASWNTNHLFYRITRSYKLPGTKPFLTS